MATLKGQNFRILTYNASTQKVSVIGMATNCTVTLNANTESSETKDDVGAFAKPEVTLKSWQVQVDSLNVLDIGTFLTAIKNGSKFTLTWAETSTTNNQTVIDNPLNCKGEAYLTDATFTFDNRTNAAKSLQFTGIGAFDHEPEDWIDGDTEVISAGTYTKGQFVRLFIGNDNTTTPSKCVAAARSLSLHISVNLESATTKDTYGDWEVQEPTGISFDISTSALMRSGEDINQAAGPAQAVSDIESIYENSSPVKFQIANVSGANNRTKGSVIVSGSVIITSLTLNGQQRGQVADYTAQLNGYGEYTVGA